MVRVLPTERGCPRFSSPLGSAQDWLAATDPAEQKRIALALNMLAMEEVATVPVGQFYLRTAFRRTVEDPEFQADLQRQRLALDPTFGAEAQEIIARLYQSPAKVVERTRKIVQFSVEP